MKKLTLIALVSFTMISSAQAALVLSEGPAEFAAQAELVQEESFFSKHANTLTDCSAVAVMAGLTLLGATTMPNYCFKGMPRSLSTRNIFLSGAGLMAVEMGLDSSNRYGYSQVPSSYRKTIFRCGIAMSLGSMALSIALKGLLVCAKWVEDYQLRELRLSCADMFYKHYLRQVPTGALPFLIPTGKN